MDSLERPKVTPERYRELEVLAMQMMMQLPHQHLGQCMIVMDLCLNTMRRWVANERLAQHEIDARKGFTLVAETGGQIVKIRPASE